MGGSKSRLAWEEMVLCPKCAPIHNKGLPKDPRQWSDKDINEAAQALFEAIDTDHNQGINVGELADFFDHTNETLEDFDIDGSGLDSKQVTEELITKYDLSADGELSFDEFLPLFKDMLSRIIESHHLKGLENAIHRSFKGAGGVVRMLIVGLNYAGTSYELTCLKDCQSMTEMANAAGVQDIEKMYDDKSTDLHPYNYNFVKGIRNVGSRCGPNDILVVYYAGHGSNVPDADGDEEDGMDEAFCCTDANGDITEDSVLIDDDFSKVLAKFVPKETRILVITDCCHSGSIVDLDTFAHDHEVVAMAAAMDDECAEEEEGVGGGKFTVAMQTAVEQLDEQYGEEEYSVQEVFDRMQMVMSASEQHISIMSANLEPSQFPWPLPAAGANTGFQLVMED